jgi:hypothetical protein
VKSANSLVFVAVCAALQFFITFHDAVHAARPISKSSAAPPLREGKATAASDLGLWDDAFVPDSQDFVILRRGDELFSLTMAATAAPKKTAKTPAVEHTQIVAAAVVDKRCWLFLNSTEAAPCVVDAHSGTVVRLEIPGLKVPGSQAPGIQSCACVPHAKGVVLMVSGGDRATWPRAENRPVYFWMNLSTGKVSRLPTGWDLHHFSANERIAVFAGPPEKPLARGPGHAIDMRTGEQTEALPELVKESHVPFDWGDKQTVKPLYERRQGKGDADFFAGLSLGGLVVPVDLGLDDVRYLSMARVSDGFAGFRLRRSGASNGQPSSLWIVPFKDSRKVEAIAKDVTDFAMLGQGNAVYVTVGQGRKASSENRPKAEAFFHDRANKSSWNVLAGVERLPELDKAFAGADFIVDRMMVQLIEGFGSSRHDSLVMCLCNHHRGDLRALRVGQKKLLPSVTWRRALIITHDGRRCLTPLFREGNLPDQFWLHKSGKLLTGTYVWEDRQDGRKRHVQLSECTLLIR